MSESGALEKTLSDSAADHEELWGSIMRATWILHNECCLQLPSRYFECCSARAVNLPQHSACWQHTRSIPKPWVSDLRRRLQLQAWRAQLLNHLVSPRPTQLQRRSSSSRSPGPWRRFGQVVRRLTGALWAAKLLHQRVEKHRLVAIALEGMRRFDDQAVIGRAEPRPAQFSLARVSRSPRP